jgi:rsbT co-antagonist protein RsbR
VNAIQKERASVVIIDITGVPTVDTGVANHLIRSTRAAALLGAMCVLVGVAPAVAQTLVQLGVDLGGLVTRSDLQAGIAYALDRLGRGARSR